MMLLVHGHTSSADELRIVAAEGVVVANAVGPQQQQLRAQFEPLLKVELSFANRVCKLSDEQRRTLITKSRVWLDTFIRDFANQGGQPQVVRHWIAQGPAAPPIDDVRESLRIGVGKFIQSELPKEQAAIYEEESRKRSEFQKSVAVENLVAKIDGELKLSPEQRARLTASLIEHWDKSWAPQLEMFAHGMEIWPNVPDQWIRPHLSDAQQRAWGRLSKHSGHIFFGGNMFGDGQVIDDIDLNEGQDQAGETRDGPVAAAAAAR
jgi:hypothetical protein